MKKIINIIKLKKIFRVLFPINELTNNYFEKRIQWKPKYENHLEVDGIYIVKFDSEFLIAMRDYKHSDILVYDQVFIEEQYKIVLNILSQYNTSVFNIIDAGSNVGYTSLYFAKYLTNVKIIAIEPSPENVAILKKNIELNNLENFITIKEMALSNDSTKKFENSQDYRDKSDWSNTTIEDCNGKINSITINEIILNEKWKYIDFLKIDIEGYEKELFKSGSNMCFLKYTKIIAIEVHEDVMSKSELELILISHNFLIFNSGELTIGLNKEYI